MIHNCIIMLAVCISTVIVFSQYDMTQYTNEDIAEQQALNALIDEHANETIYLGMNSTQYLLNENIWESDNVYFDDGQIEYFCSGYLGGSFVNDFFYDEEIKTAALSYRTKLNEMVENREFSIVAVTNIDNMIDKTKLDENYELYNSYNIKNDVNFYGSDQCYVVDVWRRKK